MTESDVDRLTKKLHANGLVHSCMTCTYFREHATENGLPAEQCILYGQRPPARVIAYGCESWKDGIPF